MILKIAIFVAAILQVAAAGYLGVGSFETSVREFTVYIQPAGWAFSLWGLIYLLSFVYATYQLIPRNDNPVLQTTRVPALIAFLSSIAWLFFAGMTGVWVWLTIPILFAMAIALTRVVTAGSTSNDTQTLLSKQILFPYAAWTGIASWLNIQSLLSEQSVITSETINLLSNGSLFAGIAAFTLFYFRRTSYSIWYGGVLVWAGVAIVAANLAGGSVLFAILGGGLALVVTALYINEQFAN